jgi:hypothetical protein
LTGQIGIVLNGAGRPHQTSDLRGILGRSPGAQVGGHVEEAGYSGVMSKGRCIVTVHLAHDPSTSAIVRDASALIIGADGIHQTRVLTPAELALFGSDDRHRDFEAELIGGEWRLIRRAGTS